MTSGADLFVVCKQCGSEVSPYITECPYCGARLRRRAPKLPRANEPARSGGGALGSLIGRTRRAGSGAAAGRPRREASGRWDSSRPYATIALIATACVVWIAFHAEPLLYVHMAVIGPLQGDWWKLLTNEFAYVNGFYAFVALFATAIFGWLLERRHGPVVVLALFFGAGAAGALVALAVYQLPLVSGANGAALALLAAWAAPDIQAARTASYYEGDLLGAGALAALLLALPFARPEASWLAGVSGGMLGLVVGLGLRRSGEGDL
jgi:membrane associated rhomboid family serine protease